MKKALFLLIMILIASINLNCSKQGLVKSNTPNLLSFHFFIFLITEDRNLNGAGDAVLIMDNVFKLRIYDNILNNHLFDLLAEAGGKNSVILPESRTIYNRDDPAFSLITSHYLYSLLTPEFHKIGKDNWVRDVVKENNRIKQIIFTYFEQSIKIEIAKRFDDGRPKRLIIQMNNDRLVFDILSYDNYDFAVNTPGFKEINVSSSRSLFEWLGDFYAER